MIYNLILWLYKILKKLMTYYIKIIEVLSIKLFYINSIKT